MAGRGAASARVLLRCNKQQRLQKKQQALKWTCLEQLRATGLRAMRNACARGARFFQKAPHTRATKHSTSKHNTHPSSGACLRNQA